MYGGSTALFSHRVNVVWHYKLLMGCCLGTPIPLCDHLFLGITLHTATEKGVFFPLHILTFVWLLGKNFLSSDWLHVGSFSVHLELSDFFVNQHGCFNIDRLSLKTNENACSRTTLCVLGGAGRMCGKKSIRIGKCLGHTHFYLHSIFRDEKVIFFFFCSSLKLIKHLFLSLCHYCLNQGCWWP